MPVFVLVCIECWLVVRGIMGSVCVGWKNGKTRERFILFWSMLLLQGETEILVGSSEAIGVHNVLAVEILGSKSCVDVMLCWLCEITRLDTENSTLEQDDNL